MTYSRVVNRNDLQGDYDYENERVWANSLIAGDLRRLEQDQRDESHLEQYAEQAGVTTEQAKAVLDAFFEGDF